MFSLDLEDGDRGREERRATDANGMGEPLALSGSTLREMEFSRSGDWGKPSRQKTNKLSIHRYNTIRSTSSPNYLGRHACQKDKTAVSRLSSVMYFFLIVNATLQCKLGINFGTVSKKANNLGLSVLYYIWGLGASEVHSPPGNNAWHVCLSVVVIVLVVWSGLFTLPRRARARIR